MEHKDNQKVKRGEIYLYDFGNNEGSIQNGIRPVLIVVCQLFFVMNSENTLICFTPLLPIRGFLRLPSQNLHIVFTSCLKKQD